MIVNDERIARDVIVIAGSAGSLQPLVQICAALSPGLAADVVVVWHRNPFADGNVLAILRRASPLPGGGFDGTAGCIDIKAAGGLTLVQALEDADIPFMPRHALQADDVDASLPLARIPEAIRALSTGSPLSV